MVTSSRKLSRIQWRSGALGATLAVVALLVAVPANAQPCAGDARRAELDFLLGSWEVVADGGPVIARATTTSEAGGCVINEVWDAGDVVGRSITYFDPETKTWKQQWIDSLGRVVSYSGTVKDSPDGKTLSFEGQHVSTDGSVERARLEIVYLDDGTQQHVLQLASPSGDWAEALRAHYRPLDEQTRRSPTTEPRADSPRRRATERRRSRSRETEAPSPAAEPAEHRQIAGSQVTASSAPPPEPPPEPETAAPAVETLTPAATDVDPEDRIRMASPMVLKFPLGPVENLPDGYSWRTDETRPYYCEGVSVHQVTVTPRQKRKRWNLEIELGLFSTQFLTAVDAKVELLDASGNAVASEMLDNISVGRGITAQADYGTVDKAFVLDLDKSGFEALLQGATRPEVQVTITSRE